MGQTQIILIVLITVIVGLATIIAINTMQESHISANEDAIKQKLIEVTGKAHAYYRRPITMSGGGDSFQSIELKNLDLETSMTEGTFSIIDATDSSFVIEVIPLTNGDPIFGHISASGIEFRGPD